MKHKDVEIIAREITGIFDVENMGIEVDGELVTFSELSDYDGFEIKIRLEKI